MRESDDAELLQRYAETGDGEAFAALVHRHLPVVYAAAVRQTGNAETARDVAQLVFASLARQARELRGRPVLLSWLYTAVHYTAAKARRAEQRRLAREDEAFRRQEMTRLREGFGVAGARVTEWEQLRPVLDEAMHELGDGDREALLLRFFQGMSFGEMTGPLRVSEDGARKRVERALEKLRGALTKRGIASTTAALAHALAAIPAPDAVPGLGHAIVDRVLEGRKAVRQSGGRAVGQSGGRTVVIRSFGGLVGAAIVAWPVSQWTVARERTLEIATIRQEVAAVTAVTAKMGDLRFEISNLRSDAGGEADLGSSAVGTSVLGAGGLIVAWPSNPAVEVVEQLVRGELVTYRTGAVDPGGVDLVPMPEDFAQRYPNRIDAAIGLRERMKALPGFLESHAVLGTMIDSLAETAELLRKEAAAGGGAERAEIAERLKMNFNAGVVGIKRVAGEIAERKDERPEAAEVARRVGALAERLVQDTSPTTN